MFNAPPLITSVFYELNGLASIAQTVLEQLKQQQILVLKGQMGAGKTTLVQALCVQLGVEDVVSSPSFAIVNEYHAPKDKLLYHFDFYRMEDEEEVHNIGVEEYFYSGNLCFIEWAEKIPSYLPDVYLLADITIEDEKTRKLELYNYGG